MGKTSTRTPSNGRYFTLAALLCLSLCAFSFAMKYPMGDVKPTCRQIIDAIQPTIAIVTKDTAVVSTGLTQDNVKEIELGEAPDTVPELDEPLLGPIDSSFLSSDSNAEPFAESAPESIAADTSSLPPLRDATTFVGTEPVEIGTTPPVTPQ